MNRKWIYAIVAALIVWCGSFGVGLLTYNITERLSDPVRRMDKAIKKQVRDNCELSLKIDSIRYDTSGTSADCLKRALSLYDAPYTHLNDRDYERLSIAVSGLNTADKSVAIVARVYTHTSCGFVLPLFVGIRGSFIGEPRYCPQDALLSVLNDSEKVIFHCFDNIVTTLRIIAEQKNADDEGREFHIDNVEMYNDVYKLWMSTKAENKL